MTTLHEKLAGRAFLVVALLAVAGCQQYGEAVNAYTRGVEDMIASDAFLRVREACDAGSVDACAQVEQVREARRARAANTRGSVGGGYRPNAYGPGLGADQFGRPVYTQPGTTLSPNAYGPGVHSDQYGRAVRCVDRGGALYCG